MLLILPSDPLDVKIKLNFSSHYDLLEILENALSVTIAASLEIKMERFVARVRLVVARVRRIAEIKAKTLKKS